MKKGVVGNGGEVSLVFVYGGEFFIIVWMKCCQLCGYDLKQIEGFVSFIGVDEVGCGVFVGLVVVGVVLVMKEFLESCWVVMWVGKINDLK